MTRVILKYYSSHMIGYYSIHYKNGEIVRDYEDYYDYDDFLVFLAIISKCDKVDFVVFEGFEDD